MAISFCAHMPLTRSLSLPFAFCSLVTNPQRIANYSMAKLSSRFYAHNLLSTHEWRHASLLILPIACKLISNHTHKSSSPLFLFILCLERFIQQASNRYEIINEEDDGIRRKVCSCCGYLMNRHAIHHIPTPPDHWVLMSIATGTEYFPQSIQLMGDTYTRCFFFEKIEMVY